MMNDSHEMVSSSATESVVNVASLRERYLYQSPRNKHDWAWLKGKCSRTRFTKKRILDSFLKLIPIIYWLPRYRFKKDALSDVISGLTIGVMQIPQGMSYALLAGQHPVYGLYNSFIPVLFYTVLGTSRHTSMGCFAITSLMTGNLVSEYVSSPTINATSAEYEDVWDDFYRQRISYGSSIAFVTGIFLLLLSLLHFGSVVMYLSDPVISAYTFANAIHIISSQVKGLLGVSTGRYSGPLNLIWIIRDNIKAIVTLGPEERVQTHVTVVISIICIFFLLAVKEINERYKSKFPYKLFIPGEIIIVIIGTGVSYGMNLKGKYNVDIIGTVPKGLPKPNFPPSNHIVDVIGESIPIAIVGYAVAVSIAKVFGSKFGYKIRPNQELVAYGCSNTVGSFFSCFPAFPSMSRSCVQVDSGGRTQIVSLISACFILFVLLVIGPLFESIPKAVLSSIVVVAMKGMLRKVWEIKPLWKQSKLDGMTWIVTTIATLLLDVVYGLVVGIAISLFVVVLRTQISPSFRLGKTKEEDRFLPEKLYRKQLKYEIDTIVFSFGGPLHYINKSIFRKKLVKSTNLDPVMELAKRKKSKRKNKHNVEGNNHRNELKEVSYVNKYAAMEEPKQQENGIHQEETRDQLRNIIVDCNAIVYTDSVGVRQLISVKEDYKEINVDVYLANCSDRLIDDVTSKDYVNCFKHNRIFMSVNDAIRYTKNTIKSTEEECCISAL